MSTDFVFPSEIAKEWGVSELDVVSLLRIQSKKLDYKLIHYIDGKVIISQEVLSQLRNLDAEFQGFICLKETVLGDKSDMIPLKSRSAIYFLIKNNEIVYVGKSLCVLDRISAHLREGIKDFDYATVYSMDQHMLDNYEMMNICHHNPKYNADGAGYSPLIFFRRLIEASFYS